MIGTPARRAIVASRSRRSAFIVALVGLCSEGIV